MSFRLGRPQVARNRTFNHTSSTSDCLLGYSDLKAELDENGRTYTTPSGQRYPSITTILSLRSKDDIQFWRDRVGDREADRVSRFATNRGTELHNIAERYINNEEEYILPSTFPHIVQLFKAIQPVIDNRIDNIVLQECALYSDKLKLAGRVDLIADFDEKLSIIDFKTSSRHKTPAQITSYFIQMAFYAAAFYERTGVAIKQSVIVMAVDGSTIPSIFTELPFTWIPELVKCRAEYEKETQI